MADLAKLQFRSAHTRYILNKSKIPEGLFQKYLLILIVPNLNIIMIPRVDQKRSIGNSLLLAFPP